ncbi:acyltransferase family protein [Marinicella rhabdoformis]|uniref:acyltransferase family protein n=1 Tax=Marinicella rhabdoformis TaxID=2580566 RepID=UPI002483CBA8|nr:acyltransferase [Marinicella rhabdoformis]
MPKCNKTLITNSNQNSVLKRFYNYIKIGSKPGKIPELDGLRALAIIMVLYFHFATFYREHHGSYFNHLFSDLIQRIMFNGWLGVDLFFVLSGYLIFHHLNSSQEHKPSPSRYALKRVLRTFPLYYAMLLLVALKLTPYHHTTAGFLDYVIHLAFLQDYIGTTVLVPLWSLATEEKFYLLAPFLLLFLKRISHKKGLLILVTVILLLNATKAILIYQSENITNYITFFTQFRAPFHFAITSILMGVIVALLCQRRQYQIRTFWLKSSLLNAYWLIFSILLIIVITCFTNLYQTTDWQWVNLMHLIMVTCFGLIVWHVTTHSGITYLKCLTGRFLRIVSVLSYALYLTHYAVLPWTYRLHIAYIFSEEAWVHASTFALIYIGLTVIFSLILHYIVEKPFLILKARL